ncbi:PP174 [Orf virus]|uniref:PP174 n=1 Tax=Orf virus TaxID=10258 RepID=F1AX08_ORFV|nr:PP174 [Orf virus]
MGRSVCTSPRLFKSKVDFSRPCATVTRARCESKPAIHALPCGASGRGKSTVSEIPSSCASVRCRHACASDSSRTASCILFVGRNVNTYTAARKAAKSTNSTAQDI